MSVTAFSFSNTTSTTLATATASTTCQCTLNFWPEFALWANTPIDYIGSTVTTPPPIATTNIYLDPANNRSISSDVICNWNNVSDAYVQPDYYRNTSASFTVNEECTLLRVMPSPRIPTDLLYENVTRIDPTSFVTATYPTVEVFLGSIFSVNGNVIKSGTCTTTEYYITTTNVIYTFDTTLVSSKGWWYGTLPMLSDLLPGLPEVTECGIAMQGSPTTLVKADDLTVFNTLQQETTTAGAGWITY